MGTRPLLRFDREYYGSFEQEPPEHPWIQGWASHAHRYSRRALLRLRWLEGRLEEFERQGWDGVVFDLRERPVEESKLLLERLAPVAASPIKPSR